MAVKHVLEAACGIQEIYSLEEMSLLSNVTRSFINVHFLIMMMMRKDDNVDDEDEWDTFVYQKDSCGKKKPIWLLREKKNH